MMEKEMYTKYNRLNDRLNELSTINTNIGKLAFYLNENKVENENCELALKGQLGSMFRYRDALQDRIANGYY